VRRLADGGVVTVASPLDATIVASRERPVRFSPSMFVWRRLLVGSDPAGPVTVLYQAPAASRFLRPDAAPAELVEMLSALADDTRLRVLKLIAERPRTAQELAPIVGMSTTGLSKSLRRLADAGLVASRREGYYVVYSLNTAQIRSLPLALEQFLRGGSDSETRAA
jgi:DNA-binding transcriptional ArsR family regulator